MQMRPLLESTLFIVIIIQLLTLQLIQPFNCAAVRRLRKLLEPSSFPLHMASDCNNYSADAELYPKYGGENKARTSHLAASRC
jgi:hypothetical protein